MASQNLLSAFEDLGNALDGQADTVLNLPMAQVYEDPDNPRQVFDAAEIAALAETLKARGLLQPIVVRPPDDQGRYRIRFGARRHRAAQRAGFTEIRALVRDSDGSDQDDLIEQLIENDQREGLTTAELAKAVDRLLEGGLTQAAVAERLGRPKPQISMLASIKAMPKELQDLAPRLGVRTLYELNTAWKADAGRARLWLKGRDARAITQAEARELAGRPAPSRQVVRDPSDGTTHETHAPSVRAGSNPDAKTRSAAAVSATSRDEAAPPPGTAVFEVRARGLRGELVLDNVRAPSLGAMVRLKDGSLRMVPAADLKIVRVRPG